MVIFCVDLPCPIWFSAGAELNRPQIFSNSTDAPRLQTIIPVAVA